MPIGDDCAVLDRPDGPIAVSTDTLNLDIHFDRRVTARDLGHKALAVSLSDLAAMGARPRWALLNLSLPEDARELGVPREQWLDGFMAGFLSLADHHGVALVGGDTCAGAMAVTVTVLGEAGERPLQRGGAGPGDRVLVSGTLGAAALALAELQAGRTPAPDTLRRLDRPEPRLSLGRVLAGRGEPGAASRASACIDLSDGLLADLGHLATASGCGAVLQLEKLPAEPELAELDDRARWNLQLAGGDDYELCFTMGDRAWEELQAWAGKSGLKVTEIGRMEPGSGVRCLLPDGREYRPPRPGYRHFGDDG